MPFAPRLRVLVITRCFPNRAEPLACAFARQQLGCLSRMADVEVRAPIPWLPGASFLGDRTRAGRLGVVPRRDQIDGIPVSHPRALYAPGAGRIPGIAALNAPLYLASLLPEIGALRGRFDVVLGTFLYPDAVAAAAVAKLLDRPFVLKAHGTDLDVVARWPSVRPMIRAAVRRARFSLGVSRPMLAELSALGAPVDRAVMLENGVDHALFYPRDRGRSRRALGLPEHGKLILFVGDLTREKGAGELADAWASLRRASETPLHLVMVGEGPMSARIEEVAAHLGDPDRGRVILTGMVPLTEVAEHLGACDLLALPSHHEGTPNVVLEALASGRPVVGSRVGGIPDAVPEGRAGLLVMPRDVDDLTRALREALDRRWDEGALLSAAPPSWEESAARLHDLLFEAAFGPASAAARRAERADRIWS